MEFVLAEAKSLLSRRFLLSALAGEGVLTGIGWIGGNAVVAAAIGLAGLLLYAGTMVATRAYRKRYPSAPSRLRHNRNLCRRVNVIAEIRETSLDLITTCEGCGATVRDKQRRREREPGLPAWAVAHGEPDRETNFAGLGLAVALGVHSMDHDKESLYKCCVFDSEGRPAGEKNLVDEGSHFSEEWERRSRIQGVEEWSLMYPEEFTNTPKPLKDGLYFVEWYALAGSDRLVKRDVFELKRGHLAR